MDIADIKPSSQDQGFHVPGYGIGLDSGDFDRIEQNVAKQTLAASVEWMEKTQRMGFHLTGQEL